MPVSTLVRRSSAMPNMPFNPAYGPQMSPQQPMYPPPTPFDASMTASNPLWGAGMGEGAPRAGSSVIAGLYNQNPYWIRPASEMPPIPPSPRLDLPIDYEPTPTTLQPMDVEPPPPLPPELGGLRTEQIPLPPPRPQQAAGTPAAPKRPVTAGKGGGANPPLGAAPTTGAGNIFGGGTIADQLAMLSRLTRENAGGHL